MFAAWRVGGSVKIALQVTDQCRKNPVTSVVHRNTYSYQLKLHQLFFVFFDKKIAYNLEITYQILTRFYMITYFSLFYKSMRIWL